MPAWLLKTEPSTYSYDDLARDKRTTWDGVANATARIHLRAMKKGDVAIIYHTGDERAAVGLAEVTKAAYPDPKGDSEKAVVVDLKPTARFAKPVDLAQIKADKAFTGWDLIRIGRLSVVPTSDAMLAHLIKLGGAKK